MHPTTADMGQSIDHYFKNNFVEVTDPLNRSSGKQIFVAKERYRDFDEIMKSRNKNFNNLYIYKQLASLKGAGILNSMFSRYTVLSRMLPIEGGQIIYCVWLGRIYQLDYKFIKGAKNIPAGLYRVRKNADTNKKWTPDLKGDAVMQIDQLRTKHLAVNGQCEDISDAARYMPAMN